MELHENPTQLLVFVATRLDSDSSLSLLVYIATRHDSDSSLSRLVIIAIRRDRGSSGYDRRRNRRIAYSWSL